MNSNEAPPTSPKSLVVNHLKYKDLLTQLVTRDVASKYKGTVFGIFWAVTTPLFMLLVYTYVFSTVFQARWGANQLPEKSAFAILLFIGLTTHNLFSESVSRSCEAIRSNTNYVKRVIFPLELLPTSIVISSLVQYMINITLIILATIVTTRHVPFHAVFLPVVAAPLIIFSLAISYLTAALGVFIRDLAQTLSIVLNVLLFVSPVFYPVDAIPIEFRGWLHLNPLTFIIEQTRAVLYWNAPVYWQGVAISYAASILMLWLAYAFFQKTRRGFADVL